MAEEARWGQTLSVGPPGPGPRRPDPLAGARGTSVGSEKHFESERMVSERWKQRARPSEGECLGSLHPVGRHPAVNGNEAPTPRIEADPRTHEAERREPVTEGHRVCHPTDGKCPEQANPQIQKAPYPWSPRWGWGRGRLLAGTGLPWGGDCSGTRQRWQRLSLANVLSAAEPRTSQMSRWSVSVLCFATLQGGQGLAPSRQGPMGARRQVFSTLQFARTFA